MKRILLILSLMFPALLFAQKYAVENMPICWNINGVDSSITRYVLASARGTTVKVLTHLNASAQKVDVSGGGTFTNGYCECQDNGGTGGPDGDWGFVSGNTILDPVYRDGHTNIFTQQNTHGFRVDSTFQFRMDGAQSIFDWQNGNQETRFKGLLLRGDGGSKIDNYLEDQDNSIVVGRTNQVTIAQRLGAFGFSSLDTSINLLRIGAIIDAVASESWTEGNTPTELQFYTTALQDTTPKIRLTVRDTGRISFNDYINFEDGIPERLIGNLNTNHNTTVHTISGTPGAGKVIGINGAADGLEWKDSTAFVQEIIIPVQNVAAIAAYPAVVNGTKFHDVWTGAEFLVQATWVSGYGADGVAVITLTGGNYAVLQTNEEGSYSLRHFGGVGDGVTNDETAIQKGFAFSRIQKKNLHGEQGDNYFMATLVENIDIDANFNFKGNGCKISSVSNPVIKILFNITESSDSNIIFQDFEITAPAEHNVVIVRDDSINITNNIRAFEVKNGASNIEFNNVNIYNCIDGIKITKNTDSLEVNNVVIRDVYLENCSQSLSIFKCNNVTIINSESNRVKMSHGQDHSHHTYLSDAKNIKFFNYRTYSKVDSTTGRVLRISHSDDIKLVGCTFTGGATTHIETSSNISLNDCTLNDTKYIISGAEVTNFKLINSTIINSSTTGNGLSLFNALGQFHDIQINNIRTEGKILIELGSIKSARITNSTFYNPLDLDGTTRVVTVADNSAGKVTFDNVLFLQDTLTANQIEFVRIADGTDDTNVLFDNCKFEIKDITNSGLRVDLGTSQVGATQLTTYNNCTTENINSIIWGSATNPHVRINNFLSEDDELPINEYNIVSANTTLRIENTMGITSNDTITIADNNEWKGRRFEIIPSSFCYVKSASGKLINDLAVFRVNGKTEIRYNGTSYETHSIEWIRDRDFLFHQGNRVKINSIEDNRNITTSMDIRGGSSSSSDYGLLVTGQDHDHISLAVRNDKAVAIGRFPTLTGASLEIANAGSTQFLLERISTATKLSILASSTRVHLDSPNHELVFRTASTDRINISLTGNVGINESVPDAKLEVVGDCIITSTIYHNAAKSIGDFIGTGSPEGVITAGIGSLFIRTDGGAGTSRYFKESGTGNTGWIAK